MKFIKWLLGGVFVVTAVTILAGILIVANIDPNDYKPQIREAILQSSGYDVVFNGDLSLSGFPLTQLKAGQITVSNKGETLARAGVIHVRISLLPLLRGVIESGGITVGGAEVMLKRNKAGVGNWEAETSAPAKTEQKEGADSASGVAVVLADVKVENSRIVWVDEAAKQTLTVTIASLESDGFSPGEPSQVSMRGAIHDGSSGAGTEVLMAAQIMAENEPQMRVRLSQVDIRLNPYLSKTKRLPELALNGAFIVSPDKQHVRIERAALRTGGAEIKATGMVSGKRSEVAVASNDFHARKLLEEWGVSLPAFADDTALSGVSVKAKATYEAPMLVLDDLQVAVDQSRMNGRVGIALEQVPAVKAVLSVDSVDVAKYMPANAASATNAGDGKSQQQIRQRKKQGQKPGTGQGASEEDSALHCIALPMGGLIPVSVSLAANEVQWDDLVIRDMRVAVVADKQGADINGLSMKGLGGQYKGDVKVARKGKCMVELTSSGSASELDVVSLIAVGGGASDSMLEGGALSANHRLRMQGTTADAFLRTMNGKLDLRLSGVKVRDNKITKGLGAALSLLEAGDLKEMGNLGNLAGLAGLPGLKELSNPVGADKSDKPRAEKKKNNLLSPINMTAKVDIAKGNVHITKMRGETPRLAVVNDGGKGIDLPRQTLDLKFRVGLRDEKKKGTEQLFLPLVFSGKLEDPAIRVDTSALLKEQVERVKKQGVRKLKKRVRKKVDKELDRLKKKGREALKEKAQDELKGLLDNLLPF